MLQHDMTTDQATTKMIRESLFDKIRGREAFGRFKDAIHMNGIEVEWYRFRQEKLEKIAIEWFKANQISYTKDNG